ncbi:MAG: cytochrome c family protein [Parvularculaceae bacterium]|nr:cytochrome c family protein [Parvularculaceae bacterium]
MRLVGKGLFAAVSVLALAACGGSKESSSSAPAAPASTAIAEPAAIEPAAAEPAAVETAMVEPAAMETSAAPDAGAATHSDSSMAMPETTVADAAPAVIAVATTAAAGEDYAAFTGDAAAGKKVFVKCLACHAVAEGQNKVGPSLYGIVGRSAGSIAGFNYSAANKNSGITWTEDVMFAYLKAPQQYIKGTKMVFPGLPSGQDRADVIAYLKSVPK